MGSAVLAIHRLAVSKAQAAAANERPTGGRKLGVALMGLGQYAGGQLAPALQETRLCRLVGVITGDRAKGQKWSQRYGFPGANIYSYDTIARIAENKDIDIVYVVTPPGVHAEHVKQVASAGKHVICEKPMANSVAECDAMIDACKKAGVKLSIGYRLQFEPHHREIDRFASEKIFGAFQHMSGGHGFVLRDRVWRVEKRLAGGGSLMDMGIYVIQAACRTAGGAAPVAVTAREEPKKNPELFNEVEETLRWTMEFSNGAKCEGFTSYAARADDFSAEGPQGWVKLKPAFSYGGIDGATSQGKLKFPNINQQAAQMDDFADCILNGRDTPVPGEMGRMHLAVIEAIYEAARTGKRVAVRV
jgi:glucose-fructose oxidoreductase